MHSRREGDARGVSKRRCPGGCETAMHGWFETAMHKPHETAMHGKREYEMHGGRNRSRCTMAERRVVGRAMERAMERCRRHPTRGAVHLLSFIVHRASLTRASRASLFRPLCIAVSKHPCIALSNRPFETPVHRPFETPVHRPFEASSSTTRFPPPPPCRIVRDYAHRLRDHLERLRRRQRDGPALPRVRLVAYSSRTC